MIRLDSPYVPQVRLLVNVLPVVASEPCFALKGGTAINLFVRDMPRLSVDIDLAFVRISRRADALTEISAALESIAAVLGGNLYRFRVRVGKRQGDSAYGLLISNGTAEVKVEVSPVLRGSVYPEVTRRINPRAEEVFGFAEVPMVSFADLYAGKIVAALDRQHPRDLFDVRLLLAEEGISDDLFRAFLVYLISGDGSIARLLDPTHKPLQDLFERQFSGMTAEPVTVDDLEQARAELVAALHKRITEPVKTFLMSFKRGEPQWELLAVEHAPNLPAVRWKLHNLRKMQPDKHREALGKLERVLENIQTGARA